MYDLISRQAAIDALNDEIVRRRIDEDTNDDGALDEFDTEAILRRLPSAQLEIIRCKDCKHYYYADNRIPQEQRYVCDLDSDRWNPDDYCSYAERKTDGD